MTDRRISRAFARTALLAGMALTLSISVPASGLAACGTVPLTKTAGLCEGPATLRRSLPIDLEKNPATVGVSAGRQIADCFAWKTFAALNWPASPQCRGTPAKGGPTNRKDWTSDRVWETYKEPYELFQATNTSWNPAKLKFNDSAPRGTCNLSTGKKLLRRSLKFPLLFEDSQAFLPGATLVDQNGNTVWYEVLMNRDVFDYIRDSGTARTGAYSFGGPIDLRDQRPIEFPTPRNGASGAGAIEIKAAWKIMTASDDASRYFTQDAVIYDGTDCTEATVGLVGLHIARKVASSPKWIWATFEHDDNVPRAGSIGDGRNYNFFSKLCAKNPPPDCSKQVAIVDTNDICCPNLITYPDPAYAINQVTRLVPIQSSNKINERFRTAYAKVGSPFQYFKLIGTQWAKPSRASSPVDHALALFKDVRTQARIGGRMSYAAAALRQAWKRPCNPNGPWAVQPPAAGETCYQQIPSTLRNTSMETLIVQTDKKGTQYSADNCMNCHFAGGIDGSYLWLDAMLNPYEIKTK